MKTFVLVALPLLVVVVGLVFTGCCGAGRFKNLDGSGPQSFTAVLRWRVIDTIAGRRRNAHDRAPVRRVEPDIDRIARPPGPGEGARLTWIGHASWLVQLEGKSLLIDPVFGDLPSLGPARNVPPGIPPDKLPTIDVVLVTHNHYDHLDLPGCSSPADHAACLILRA